MNNHLKTRRWTMVIALVIAAIFLYLSFRDVDWNAMWKTIQTGRYEVLILVLFLFSLNQFLRGLRWRVLLTDEKNIPVLTVFWANNMGYFGNNFLPARAGELIRAAAVGNAAEIGTSYSLATALVERVMDAAILVLISLWAIYSLNNLPDVLIKATGSMGLLGLCALVGLFFAPHLERQIMWLVNQIPLAEKTGSLIKNFLSRFILGMHTLQKPGKLFTFLAYSAVIWTMDAVLAVLVGAAFNISIPIQTAFIIIATLGLSSAIPSTPGYVGVYQFAAVAVMTPFGYRLSDILVFILAYQALGYVGLGIWGGLGFWQLGRGKIKIPA
jgi:glycosyltransferase 2 family protein